MDEAQQKIGLKELIRHMLKASGMTAADVSRAMGKTSGYVTVMLHNDSNPRMDLFIKIAETCGYRVELHQGQDYESWDLATEGTSVLALKEFGPEDIETLSEIEATSREALKGLGRRELIDELIGYLEQLREQ